jgi:hypothetical protein
VSKNTVINLGLISFKSANNLSLNIAVSSNNLGETSCDTSLCPVKNSDMSELIDLAERLSHSFTARSIHFYPHFH